MLSLTAVIPVATNIRDISKLKLNITDALQSGVRIVVVLDQISNKENQSLEELGFHFLSFGEDFQLIRGNYGSPGKARNAGKQRVDTEFIAFWDADDRIKIQNIIKSLVLHGNEYDYIIGSYQVSCLNPVSIRTVEVRRTFGKLSIIREPGIWRMIFRNSKVSNCHFGNSFMAEDQVYLANSGLFASDRILFSNEVFYTYFTGVDGQLTSRKRLNIALFESIVEIARTCYRKSIKDLIFSLMIVCRIGLTLIKRTLIGKQ